MIPIPKTLNAAADPHSHTRDQICVAPPASIAAARNLTSMPSDEFWLEAVAEIAGSAAVIRCIRLEFHEGISHVNSGSAAAEMIAAAQTAWRSDAARRRNSLVRHSAAARISDDLIICSSLRSSLFRSAPKSVPT